MNTPTSLFTTCQNYKQIRMSNSIQPLSLLELRMYLEYQLVKWTCLHRKLQTNSFVLGYSTIRSKQKRAFNYHFLCNVSSKWNVLAKTRHPLGTKQKPSNGSFNWGISIPWEREREEGGGGFHGKDFRKVYSYLTFEKSLRVRIGSLEEQRLQLALAKAR